MPTPRARPRLLGPELPDSRAGERRAVLEGAVLRRPGRLRHGRRRQHQLHEQPCPSDRPGQRRRSGIRACVCRCFAGGRAGPPARRARRAAQRRALAARGRLSQGERSSALQPGRRAQWVCRDVHGLSRHVGLDRPDSGARRHSGLDRSVRHARRHRWRRRRLATVDRSSGSGRTTMPARRSRRSASATTSISSRTSPTFSTIPSTAISSSRPTTASSPAPRSLIAGWATGAVARCRTALAFRCRNDDISNVGLYHTVARRRLEHHPAGLPCCRRASAGYVAERNRVDAVAAHAGRPARRWLSLRCRLDEPANSGTDYAGSREPEGRRHLRARGAAPSSMRMPGSGSTATTPAVRRSRVDPIDRRACRSCDAPRHAHGAPKSAFAPCRVPHLQTSLALWTLSLDSELIFVGDAGTTEAGRPQPPVRPRVGELLLARAPGSTFDADVAVSRAHFTDHDDRLETSFQAPSPPWCRAVRPWTASTTSSAACGWRFFGPRPLVEDNSVRSERDESRQPRGGLPVHAALSGSRSTSSTCSTPGTATSTTSTRRVCPESRPRASTTCTSIRRCLAAPV